MKDQEESLLPGCEKLFLASRSRRWDERDGETKTNGTKKVVEDRLFIQDRASAFVSPTDIWPRTETPVGICRT